MRRLSLQALFIASIVAFPVCGAAADQPPTVTPEGAAPLARAAQASRTHLLGAVDLYDVAVYIDGLVRDRERLISSDVPKALRIDVTYVDDLRRQMPIDWQRELVPVLMAPATAHLRGAFAPLRRGDVVLVEYVPGKGTTVRVNKAVSVSNANHDLMLAFLDHWLGQRPVSEEMKQTLVGAQSR